MNRRPATAPAPGQLVNELPRNVYSRPYGDGKRIFFSVESSGVMGRWCLIDEGDAHLELATIVALYDALNRDDPPQRPSSRRRRSSTSTPVLTLHRGS